MGKIELKPPQGYSELDSASVKQFGELLFNTFEGDAKYSVFTRFMINKLDIEYHSLEAEPPTGNLGSKDSKVIFQWAAAPNDTSLSWGGRGFKIGVSTININGEESAISQYADIIGGMETVEVSEDFPEGETPIIPLGYSPTISVELSNSLYKDSYIAKTKFYMKDENSDIWYLQFFIDHKKNTMH